VPTSTMPSWLQSFAANQPFTLVVNAVRSYILGQPVGSAGWESLIWGLALVAIFVPLSVILYERKAV